MRELLDPPLHGIAIYNPQLLSREELLRSFVARQDQLERIVASLRREAEAQPQHHLIVGARGMGKTTLLARLRYAIEDDEGLARRCLPLVFPEEQYNVGNLADFWLNCVDALADVLESLHNVEVLEGLDGEIARIQALPAEDERRRRALELLCSLAARLDRRLVLLVDNVDMVLDRLQNEDWALREVLSAEARIQLVGATSAPLESYYRHDRAFYDFFRVHHLTGLTEDETFVVLRKLAEVTGNARISRLLDVEPARIKTVRLMSGGNPRTVILLFTLLEQGADGDVRTDLERLLDHCTPFYKHRIDALPPQVQKILDALAMHWAPATAAQIAAVTHLKVNATSSQIERLVKDGTVEKVSLPGTSRLGYQIAERFFNIWCLMRASRRVRRRLVWLVEFLRMMFGVDELTRLARRHLTDSRALDPVRRAEMGFALADAVEAPSLRHVLETESLRALCLERSTRERIAEILDLEGTDAGLLGRAERLRRLAEAREAVLAAGARWPGWDAEGFWFRLSGSFSLTLKAKHDTAVRLMTLDTRQRDSLENILVKEWRRRQMFYIPAELTQLVTAVRVGDLDPLSLTPEDLAAAAMQHGSDSVIPCALALAFGEAADVDRELLNNTIRDSRSIYSRFQWAKCAAHAAVPPAEIAERLAEIFEVRDWEAEALNWLGIALLIWGRDATSAERVFRRAIAKGPERAKSYYWLALACRELERYEEAEVAFREALALDATVPDYWGNLGLLLHRQLARYDEAAHAYRKALACDASKLFYWEMLGNVLTDHLLHYEAAEAAYREGLARDAKRSTTWYRLGFLLREHLGRIREAEAAYREAIALDPMLSDAWNGLAWLLYQRRGALDEAR